MHSFSRPDTTIMAMRTLVVVALAFAPVLAHSQDLKVAPPDAPSRVTIARAPEPGTSLTVSGRVVDPEGRPVAGVSIYAYQTDAKGEYIPGQSGGSDNPRLFGYMRSDAEGRYAFVTIRPGSYPNSRNPAHIHFEVVAPDGRTRSYEIVFEGDPFISEQFKAMARETYGNVAIVTAQSAANGGLEVVHDMRLRAKSP